MNEDTEEYLTQINFFEDDLLDDPTPFTKKRSLSPSDRLPVLRYLQNPTKSGIWTAEATWLLNSGLSKDVWNCFKGQLTEQTDGYTFCPLGEEKPYVISREEVADAKDRIFYNLTFILQTIYRLSKLDVKEKLFNRRIGQSVRKIFQAVDIAKLSDSYSDGCDHFKDNVYHPAMGQPLPPRIDLGKPYYLKAGTIFPIEEIKPKNKFVLIAWERDPLLSICILLEKVGKIENTRIRRVFSPEEEVFSPYFIFAKLGFIEAVEDDKILPSFERAFGEYEEMRYEVAISTLGRIGEDYLSRIFETLFRDNAPKRQTMGQLFDLINNEVAKLLKPPSAAIPDIDSLFETINKAIEENTETTESLKLMRQLMQVVKDERRYTRRLIDEIRQPPAKATIFPLKIRENIEELIRNRNAAAHKTRVPLGEFEALRTIYCLFTVIMWWQGELAIIDWDQPAKQIIEGLIARAGSATANL